MLQNEDAHGLTAYAQNIESNCPGRQAVMHKLSIHGKRNISSDKHNINYI